MKALCWHGKNDVQIKSVPDPKIIKQRDAIIRITSRSICGSDLYLLDRSMPTRQKAEIQGHEPMGIVEEVGSKVPNLKRGDRVFVPFTIDGMNCFFCQKTLYSCCKMFNTCGNRPKGQYVISLPANSATRICLAYSLTDRPNRCECHAS